VDQMNRPAVERFRAHPVPRSAPRRRGHHPPETRTENARDPSNPVAPGSGFVVVANRLPVDLERLPDGTSRWKRSS